MLPLGRGSVCPLVPKRIREWSFHEPVISLLCYGQIFQQTWRECMRLASRKRVAFGVAVAAGLSGVGGASAFGAIAPIALTSSSYNANLVVNAPFSSTGSYSGVDTENGISFWTPGYNTS